MMKTYTIITSIIVLVICYYLFYMNIQATEILVNASRMEKIILTENNAVNTSVGAGEIQYSIDGMRGAAKAISGNIILIVILLVVVLILSVVNLFRVYRVQKK